MDLPNPPWVSTSLKITPLSKSDYDTSIDGQLATLINQVEKQLAGLACKDIGVLQVVDLEGEEGTFEKYIKDELVNRLSRSAKFRVFPIDDLSENYENRKTSMWEEVKYYFINEPVYLTGTTVDLPRGVRVGVQIVSMKTGQVKSTASMLFRKDQALRELTDETVEGRIGHDMAGFSQYDNSSSGRVLKVSDNDFIDLIRDVYTLYIKRINFEYNLFVDAESTVEIFLNEDYRIMSVGDMLSFSYGSHEFVLSLQRVANHRAIFTFASLTPLEEDTTTSSLFNNNRAPSHLFATEWKAPDQPGSGVAILNAGITPAPLAIPADYCIAFIAGIAPGIRRRQQSKEQTSVVG